MTTSTSATMNQHGSEATETANPAPSETAGEVFGASPRYPKRVQRKRVKGWRMPENTVSVCRPGKWGNPFKVGKSYKGTRVMESAGECVAAFRVNLLRGTLGYTTEDVRRDLAGKNLACFCSLDQPCHADVLLQEANIMQNEKAQAPT